MLAVFDQKIAKCPEGLRWPEVEDGTKSGGVTALLDDFSSVHEGAVTVRLGSAAFIAFSTDKQNPFLPRLFASVDDIFCIFQGALINIPLLKQQYGLGKNATEDMIVLEVYRTLRDRGPYPVDKVVRDLNGKFAFILFDSSSNSIFIAADADGAVPFFWGTDSEDHLIVSDDVEIMKKHCGNHFAPFPKGCFYTSSGGLQSFEHPLNEVKPVPRVDSKGEVCGSAFVVDTKVKRQTSMPRVGSASDWSKF
ncbi:stem-specific protein TSJT1-like protein [Carex littledalei]|uniref:Stem-specific protein TSJT1-like protein n=1 Tax=Carex littledalei TaxID=544730 RepID=A0A833VFN7_9POAL|nr:stem-specific protein TSJT1-like protein [Carex littledalei]